MDFVNGLAIALVILFIIVLVGYLMSGLTVKQYYLHLKTYYLGRDKDPNKDPYVPRSFVLLYNDSLKSDAASGERNQLISSSPDTDKTSVVLTSAGELVLTDASGKVVYSSGTAVTGGVAKFELKVNEFGQLSLKDRTTGKVLKVIGTKQPEGIYGISAVSKFANAPFTMADITDVQKGFPLVVA